MPVSREFSIPSDGRLGWAAVEQNPESHVVAAQLVVAAAGPEGATYRETAHDERLEVSAENVIAVAGICVVRMPNGRVGVDFEAGDRAAVTRLLGEGVGGGAYLLDAGHRRWARQPAPLLRLLQHQLVLSTAGHLYPTIYYGYNLRACHEQFRRVSGLEIDTPEAMIVADPTMADETRREAAMVKAMVEGYDGLCQMDEEAAALLSSAGTPLDDDAISAFVAARRNAAEAEQRLIADRNRLHAPDVSYLPPGAQPTGRDWPYMDPLARTEGEAFGVELKALQAGEHDPAVRELSREIKELNDRRQRAALGERALHALAVAEGAAIVPLSREHGPHPAAAQ